MHKKENQKADTHSFWCTNPRIVSITTINNYNKLFNFFGSKSMEVIIGNNNFSKKTQLLTILFLDTTIVTCWDVNDVVGSKCEMDALCLENMARFKRPREYVYVDNLPKNNYGKILKTELRKLQKGEVK